MQLFIVDRLEVLNEKRSGVVQMVKLAEKERNSLEVTLDCYILVCIPDYLLE